jgi:hypothetical protein
MATRIVLIVFVCIMGVGAVLGAIVPGVSHLSASGASAAQTGNTGTPGSRVKSVTGCLQKGDEPGEYSLKGEDGKTWDVSSKTVKLDEHVGHQVTVTGSAHRESKAEEKAEGKKEGQAEKASGKQEYGNLRVTSVKMVSETCSK